MNVPRGTYSFRRRPADSAASKVGVEMFHVEHARCYPAQQVSGVERHAPEMPVLASETILALRRRLWYWVHQERGSSPSGTGFRSSRLAPARDSAQCSTWNIVIWLVPYTGSLRYSRRPACSTWNVSDTHPA